MGFAICPQCGLAFHKDQPWKTVCLGCWKHNRRAETPEGHASNELQELRREIAFLREENNFLAGELERLQERPALPSGLKGRIQDLIFLCHPDKHSGNRKATEITAWLLDVRREVAA